MATTGMACSTESSTNAEIKGRIKNIWTKFVLGVEPERLSDWLVQENVITPDQWQRIHNNYQTRESRCRALLYHLFYIPHPRAFLVVRQALIAENHYLLEYIDNQETDSGFSSLPNIQFALQDTTKTEQQEKNSADKNRVWEEEKDRLLKMPVEYEDQTIAWEADKDRLLKMQVEHEDQKRVWEADKEHLLKMQKDMETKLQLASIEQQKLENERNLWSKEKEQLLETIQELRQSLEVPECREEHMGKLTKEPAEKVEGKLDDSDASDYQMKLTEELVRKPEEEPQNESPVADPCVIEVQGIPDTATDAVVTIIFENKRYCGIADIEVAQVEMLEGGRALLTIKEPQHAKALIDKGSVAYKNHTLVISRPSKPDPVEEVTESVRHPFSNKDINETPGGNLTGQKQSISEFATVDVSNIPEDMAEETLQMIFEAKRFCGGGDVTNIVYEKGQGSAVITLADPADAKRLVHLASVVYKGLRLMVTKHVEEDRSQKPFPPRKRRNVPTSEKEQPLISDRTIKVSNILSDVNKETLEMMFESRRLGGGDTDNIAYDQTKGTATITFKDPEVAKTLIQKEVLIYKGNRLAITTSAEEPIAASKQDQASSVSRRMVDVSRIPPGMTTEMLTILLENSSGGDIESIDHDQNHNTAVATFTDSVAADVLISDESVVYKGKQLSITRHLEKVPDERKQIPKEKKEQLLASSNRKILVSHIPQGLSRNYMVMLFERKRTGGGKTEDIDYNPEHGTAVVTFEDPKIAASFIEKEVVEFKSQRMLVTKYVQAADTGHGKDSDDSASVKQQPSPMFAVSGSFNTVKVSGLSQDTSTDVVSMYFESKRRSGGGGLKLLEHRKDKGKAVIMFTSPADGLEIFKRTHVLCGATLKISPLEMPLNDVRSCAIEVKDLSERQTEHFLELYFENPGRNGAGGGPVEKVFLNKEARSAVIVFEEATAVIGVMNKRPHKLDGARLEVNVLEAAPPPPLLLSDVDTKRLLVKRLPPSTTRENLIEYLSQAAKAKMLGWTLTVKPSIALLDFSSEPDYLSIRRLVCSKPFLGKMISIRRVPLTSSILVTGMPSSVTADFVRLYFENPRNGGTGEECKVLLLLHTGSAFVEFERPDVIRTITSKKHHFEKKEVKVEPYYPWLCLSSASASSGKAPTSLTHTFDPKAVHFILKRQELKKHIEDSFEKLNCRIEWPSEGKGEVKLEYKGKEKQTPTAGWDVECKKFLQRYADEFAWKKENIRKEIWNEFKMKILEHIANKSKLDTAFENDQCEIHYIGLKKDTDEFEKVIKKIKGDLEEELERKKKRISENLANLRPHQLDLIRTEDFQKKLKQKLPDLEFELKQTEVNLCGMPDVVKKARLFILEKVTEAVQVSFELSESKSMVFAKEEAKACLMKQLLSKGISASWMCNETRVNVFAFDDKNLKEAVKVLENEVIEKRLQLSELRLRDDLFQSDRWKDFIRCLCKEDKLLEVSVNDSVLVVTCMNISFRKHKSRVEEFFAKHGRFLYPYNVFMRSDMTYQWQ